MNRDFLLISIFWVATLLSSIAQNSMQTDDESIINKQSLVSLIGDDEEKLSSLSLECSDMLLQVKDNSMTKAYDTWIRMMADLEQFTELQGYDIKGIKLWMNVFWNQDGSIKHMTFYPKPTSRNTDFKELSQVINDFASEHRLALTHSNCFSHYGSVSFPTYINLMIKGDNK